MMKLMKVKRKFSILLAAVLLIAYLPMRARATRIEVSRLQTFSPFGGTPPSADGNNSSGNAAQGSDSGLQLVFNVKTLGAKGDGVTDDTAALRNALTAADAVKGILFFPPGDYIINATSGAEVFIFHNGIKIIGSGWGSSSILARATTAHIPIFRYKPLTGAAKERGFSMRDISVLAQSGTPGKQALVLDSTVAPIANFDVSNCALGLGSDYAIAINNTKADGVFAGVFFNNVLQEGINLDNAGDTLSIIGGIITGTRGLYVNLVSGAATFNVISVNISSKQPVQVYGGLQLNFIGCVIETTQAGSTGIGGAMMYLTGGANPLVSVNITGCIFNSINGNSLDGVRLAGNVQYASFEGNQFNTPARTYGIKVNGESVTNTWVGLNNVQKGAGTLSLNTTDPNLRSPLPFSANGSVTFRTGSGNPNGVVTGSPPDVYLNVSGGAGATIWIKESGVGTNSGWVPK